MFDDFDSQDEYCGFEESDRDAWENEQVFQDTLLERDEFDDPRDEDWAMDQEDLWAEAEADGFFHDFE